MTVTINGTTGISSTGDIVTTGTGDITSVADIKAASYQESTATLTGTSPVVDCATGNVFSLTTSGTTAFQAATNVPTTGTGYSFMLKITAGGTHTVDYSLLGTNVYFAGGTAPEPPASGETDILVFTTIDGGTTWYGALAVDAAS
tara:strand:+ start:42 stop:476 length:435 start_codon:yes stop_codon:yes gene_type:complete